MPRPKKWGILGASTIILFKDIDKYVLCVVRIFMKQTLIEKFMKIHIMLAAEKVPFLFRLSKYWMKSFDQKLF